eukprot:680353-Pyramimonas_sp.AAC.1
MRTCPTSSQHPSEVQAARCGREARAVCGLPPRADGSQSQQEAETKNDDTGNWQLVLVKQWRSVLACL